MSPFTSTVLVMLCAFMTCSAFQGVTRCGMMNKGCKSSLLTMRDGEYRPKQSQSVNLDNMFKIISKVAVGSATSLALSGAMFSANVMPAFAETTSRTNTVTVLGATGKTGKLIVQYLSTQDVPVRPTSYSGSSKNIFEGLKGVEAPSYADVTKIETLEPAISRSKAVIFAASASNKGGKAAAVDYLGVENVAKECVRLKVGVIS
jgi:hypothetical protein